MPSRTNHAIALVTAPNVAVARRLAAVALEAKLVACANLIPRIESHYWWRGKREKSSEVLILFKTVRARLKPLERLVIEEHPYDTPEFIVLALHSGNRRYLDWISSSTGSSA